MTSFSRRRERATWAFPPHPAFSKIFFVLSFVRKPEIRRAPPVSHVAVRNVSFRNSLLRIYTKRNGALTRGQTPAGCPQRGRDNRCLRLLFSSIKFCDLDFVTCHSRRTSTPSQCNTQARHSTVKRVVRKPSFASPMSAGTLAA